MNAPSVQLREGFIWDCPQCGTLNGVEARRVRPGKAEVVEFVIGPEKVQATGRSKPRHVTCLVCKEEFAVKARKIRDGR